MKEFAAFNGVFAHGAGRIGRMLAACRSAWKARTLAWFFRQGSGFARPAPRPSPQNVRQTAPAKALGEEEACRLIREIEKARVEWAVAQQKLDYVVERDQIDYAIYSLEAAEKRYEMLLRQAKKAGLSLMDPSTGRIRSCRTKS